MVTIVELQARVDELTRELDLNEEALKVAEEKITDILSQAGEKVTAIVEAMTQAIIECKASINFEVEVIEGSVAAYGYGFED